MQNIMRNQPKKYINKVKLKDTIETGYPRRVSYQNTILKDAPIFPKPLNYEDIDIAFDNFVKDNIDLVIDGKKVPTFTLYSSQRFSEYSQTWQHTDEDNNLLMNFKTVNRDNNPKPGENQGGLWNIPGERRYTILTREVLDDNGTESYEIYSMKQPYATDLSYRVCFVTNQFEYINDFNNQVNNLFKSRQCYIRPNGHFIPMIIDEINDETQYSIEDRKFYVQSIVIKVMAYIINKDDFKVEKKPKRILMAMEGDTNKPKPEVNIDEYENVNLQNKTIDISIDFEPWHDKVEFEIDTDVVVNGIQVNNIRNMRLFINDTPIYYEKGFKLKNGDNILIKIKQYDIEDKSYIVFSGYDPNFVYNADVTPENVSDEVVKHENIIVE